MIETGILEKINESWTVKTKDGTFLQLSDHSRRMIAVSEKGFGLVPTGGQEVYYETLTEYGPNNECDGVIEINEANLTDGNLCKILFEFEKLKGQFVINEMNEVRRLIAIAEDEMDYYYVLYDGKTTQWQSCVGRVIQLKDRIAKDDYEYLIRIAKLNHYDLLEVNGKPAIDRNDVISFLTDELKSIGKEHKFITDLCFDLN